MNPPKKKDTVSVVDESEKPQSPEKLYRGEISKNGKRFFTSDETLFLYFSLKKSAGTMALILTRKETLTQLENWLLTH